MANLQLNSPYKGSASLTRQQFLFYEMRTTAKLIEEGVNNTEIMEKVFNENLFHYPTEKTIKKVFVRHVQQDCIPSPSFVDFATVPPELMSAFQLIPYQSAEDAVFKALGIE